MEKSVVVLHNIRKSGKAAIVGEAASSGGPRVLQGRGSVAFVRGATCLEIVDAHRVSCMHGLAWSGGTWQVTLRDTLVFWSFHGYTRLSTSLFLEPSAADSEGTYAPKLIYPSILRIVSVRVVS